MHELGGGDVVAIIPARGGSKGLPGKNLARVGGVPLVVRAVQAARAAASVDLVVVTTDADDIAAAARVAGANVIRRPAVLATDEATSEAAILHALDVLTSDGGSAPGVTVFLQATSPFIDPSDVDGAVARVRSGEHDVVFSAVESHAFIWRTADRGAYGVNHEAGTRLRRQDREPELRETGAFYVMRTEGLRTAGHRFFGRVGAQLVAEASAVEIDTAADLAVSRALVAAHAPVEPEPDVDAIVTDFDGVHTDDTVTVDVLGRESVRVNRSDGHGVRMLREAGLPLLILSRESNAVVAARAAKLQVECLHGIDDKADALISWADSVGVPLDRIAYLGNDLPDLPCMELVGWPIAVADAHPAVRDAARIVLARSGGAGAVRELADLVLAARLHLGSARLPLLQPTK